VNRSTHNTVTAQLSDYAGSVRQIVSEMYTLAGRLSDDLYTMPAKQQVAAQQRGLPAPATFDHDSADVRYALEHAHALHELLPAAAKLTEAVLRHLEKLDDSHRLQIDGPTREELPPDTWS